MSEWQPIETAPKDGTAILVWTGRRCTCANWSNRQFKRWNNGWDHDRNGFIDPTHWMPLPEPPA